MLMLSLLLALLQMLSLLLLLLPLALLPPLALALALLSAPRTSPAPPLQRRQPVSTAPASVALQEPQPLRERCYCCCRRRCCCWVMRR